MNYKRFLPLLPAILLFFALYHHVIGHLVEDWLNDDNYSHGFLVPLISAYLIWQDRKKLAQIETRPANAGLFFLLMSCLFFLCANIGAELFTMRLSMIMVILSSVLFFAGWQFTRAVLWPTIYLIFMIPIPAIIWNKIAFPLKLFATHLAVDVTKLLNITVYSEGNIIYLANTTLEVVDACSGLRSLTSLLALSAAFALVSNLSRTKKVILFLSAIPIAIATNILRLSSTAVLATRFGEEVAQGFLHETSGILVFFLALALLFLFHSFLDKFRATP
jgi:exosortase A